jgi:hypothetical protein
MGKDDKRGEKKVPDVVGRMKWAWPRNMYCPLSRSVQIKSVRRGRHTVPFPIHPLQFILVEDPVAPSSYVRPWGLGAPEEAEVFPLGQSICFGQESWEPPRKRRFSLWANLFVLDKRAFFPLPARRLYIIADSSTFSIHVCRVFIRSESSLMEVL